MKLPINISSFEELRKGGYAYVDKTAIIHELTNRNKFCTLTRPRGFGKTLLLSTIQAYFEGRKDLFEGLAISSLETKWEEYPILRLDLTGHDYSKEGELERVLGDWLSEQEAIYGINKDPYTPGLRLSEVIRKANEKTGKSVVLLVDGYEKAVNDNIGTPEAQKIWRDLVAFYVVVKASDVHLKYVLMTGINYVVFADEFGGYNNASYIGDTYRYKELTGISEKELDAVFREQIGELAEAQNCTYDEAKARLMSEFGGYNFSHDLAEVCNPYCVMQALNAKNFESDWLAYGVSKRILGLLNERENPISSFVGEHYNRSMSELLNVFQYDPMTEIYHEGIVAIRDYLREDDTYDIDIPNKCVARSLLPPLADKLFKPEGTTPSEVIESLYRMLDSGDEKLFARRLKEFINTIPTENRPPTDRRWEFWDHFVYIFYLIFWLLSLHARSFVMKRVSMGDVAVELETSNRVYLVLAKYKDKGKDVSLDLWDDEDKEPCTNSQKEYHKIGLVFSPRTMNITKSLFTTD